MDTKFQTSFIPKTVVNPSLSRSRSESVSVVLIISIVVFVITLASAGGVFAYKKVLIGQIEQKNTELSVAKNSFDTESIKNWSRLSRRIDTANTILSSHVAVSPIFNFLENNTLASVKFETFSYETKEGGSSFLSVTGQAKSFESVALQSDIFAKEKNINGLIFSDLNADQTGAIVFKFSGIVDPSLISYKNSVEPAVISNN